MCPGQTTGRQLLSLYRTTGEEKYRIAADTLSGQTWAFTTQ
jgi:hypothetical protein